MKFVLKISCVKLNILRFIGRLNAWFVIQFDFNRDAAVCDLN